MQVPAADADAKLVDDAAFLGLCPVRRAPLLAAQSSKRAQNKTKRQ